MSRLFSRRPSASLIISIVALVLAASGTAVAATHLTSGDKLIKKRSLSANRLKRHSLTASQVKKGTVTAGQVKKGTLTAAQLKKGTLTAAQLKKHTLTATQIKNHTLTATQINLKKIGTVPSATSAETAKNATDFGGEPPSYYEQSSGRTGTKGIVGAAAGQTVSLFAIGPFNVTMTCASSAAGTSLTINGTSSIAGADLNGNLGVAAGASVDLGGSVDIAATTAAATADDVTMDFEAPGGDQAIVSGATGVNSLGAPCWANFAGIA